MTLSQNLAQFVRFGIVGSIGFVVDIGSYTALTLFGGWKTVYCLGLFGGGSFTTTISAVTACTSPRVSIIAANMVSVFLAVVSNFILNKFWTFRDRSTEHLALQGGGYFGMSCIAWVLNQVLTGFFVSHVLLLHSVFGDRADLAAKVLAILVVLFFNYGGSRFVIFRRPGVSMGAS